MSLNDNLVAFWKLGEANGATRIDSIGSNNLADHGTVTQVAGQIGNAAKFVKASSQYLDISDNSELRTGDVNFTIAGWVYLTSKPVSSVAMYIASKWTDSSDQREWSLLWNETLDLFQFTVSPTGTSSSVTLSAASFGTPAIATWYFIVAWHDADNDTLNIQVNDGPTDSLAHTTGVFGGTSIFQIGRLDTVGHLNGQVDAVGWWKGRTLSILERSQLYNEGAGVEPPFLESTYSAPVTVVTQKCDSDTGFIRELILPRIADGDSDPTNISNFLNEQAELIERKYNTQVVKEVPCDACVVDGAVVLDFGRCASFEILVDQDINSISFINAAPGDEVDILFRANKDATISGWPDWFACRFCGDVETPVQIKAGQILRKSARVNSRGSASPKGSSASNCLASCMKQGLLKGVAGDVIAETCAEACPDAEDEPAPGPIGGGGGSGGGGQGSGESTATCPCTPDDGDLLTVAICTEIDCEAAEPKVVLTVCGGTPPYAWSTVGGENPTGTVTGSSDRNFKLEPTANTTPGEPGTAYARGHAEIRSESGGCVGVVQAGATYNCAGVKTGSCTNRPISEIGIMPTVCEHVSAAPLVCCRDSNGPCCGQGGCADDGNCEPCEQRTVDLRTQGMIDNGCKPCSSTMDGVIVTVTDAVGAVVSTVVRT